MEVKTEVTFILYSIHCFLFSVTSEALLDHLPSTLVHNLIVDLFKCDELSVKVLDDEEKYYEEIKENHYNRLSHKGEVLTSLSFGR